MLDLLLCTDIDDRDFRLLLLVHQLQEELGTVRYNDLSEALGVGRATIARRISGLKELGLLVATRTGSKTVSYEVPLLHLGEVSKSEPGQNSDVLPEFTGDKPVTSHPGDTSQNAVTSHLGDTSDPKVRSHLSEVSPHIIYLDTYLERRNYNRNCSYPERAEGCDMKISGPDDALKDLICSSRDRTEKAKADRKARQRERQEHFEPDLSPEKIEVEGRYDAPKTAPDMNLLFQRLWQKKGLKGKPIRWTKKELAQVKDMIQDQGPEVVVGYLEYVFENWEKLQRRFRITGYPSVPALYGYRRTWLTEYQNGESGPKNLGMAEYNETEAKKIPSGRWE